MTDAQRLRRDCVEAYRLLREAKVEVPDWVLTPQWTDPPAPRR